MRIRSSMAFLVLSLIWPIAGTAANDVDQSMGTIHKIDLSDSGPKAPNYILIIFDVKKLKAPGSRGHSILRQFAKRLRVEFEGAGLPKGKYALAVAPSCPGTEPAQINKARYKKGWTELHQFKIISSHVSTEKSQADTALRPGGKGKLILEGKSLALFQVNGEKYHRIDCKPIN